MSRSGDEMIFELERLLGGINKSAAKKDKDKDEKDEEKDKDKDEKDEEKDKDKDEEKDKDKDEKDEEKGKDKKSVLNVLHGLSKLASELDHMGAEKASELVDGAMKAIVAGIDEVSFEDESDSETSLDDFDMDQMPEGTFDGGLDPVEEALNDPVKGPKIREFIAALNRE